MYASRPVDDFIMQLFAFAAVAFSPSCFLHTDISRQYTHKNLTESILSEFPNLHFLLFQSEPQHIKPDVFKRTCFKGLKATRHRYPSNELLGIHATVVGRRNDAPVQIGCFVGWLIACWLGWFGWSGMDGLVCLGCLG